MSNRQRYISMMEVYDTTPIESKVNAFLKTVEWPGYPKNPGNSLPLQIHNIDKFIPDIRPIPPPGGRVFRRNQRYSFLSDYNTYP